MSSNLSDMFSNSSWSLVKNITFREQLNLPARPSPTVEIIVLILFHLGNVFGVVSIVLNSGLILGMQYVEDKALPYYRLIQNLAVADLFAAITFLITQNWPHGPISYIDPDDHFALAHGLSYMFRGTPWMFFTVCLLTLCNLTWNQYVAVCKPWKYSEWVTSRTTCISLLLTWGLSSLQLIIPLSIFLALFSIEDKREAMAVLYKVSVAEMHFWMGFFLVTIFVNIVFDVLVSQKIKVLKMKRQVASSNVDSQNIKKKEEALVTLLLLLLASIFLRLPFPLMGIIGLNVDYSMGAAATELVDTCVVFVLYLNFFVDPIVIVSRTQDLKHAYKLIFAACRRN